MSGTRPAGRNRPPWARWRDFWSGRTLGTRLITGVLLLLVGACAAIGVVTYFAIRGSMVSSLDGQVRSSSGTYATCIENTRQATAGRGGAPVRPGGDPDDYQPPPNDISCSQGQPQGMLGIRIKGGEITNCSVVNGMNNQECPPPSAADKKALTALPVYHPAPNEPPPWPAAA